jgi:uncharacterized tellurite resistance protein B-like protein
MTPIENLHYAIGQLAYAVAKADGEIQKEEMNKFANIVAAELRMNDPAFDVSDIIFQIMNKDKVMSAENAYSFAMEQIRMNSHYLTPQLKDTFINVMMKVAKAFPPITQNETSLIDKFRQEIKDLNGDPVYTNSKN